MLPPPGAPLSPPDTMPPMESASSRWRELALLFLRLGATAFGGPAAHIAVMEDEVVRRRGWLSREEFLDLVGATNLIPGPNSTELAIHIGRLRGGVPGLVIAGACFILPAALIVTALAWAYVRFGGIPAVADLLYGAKPVVLAVVVQAIVRLAPVAMRNRVLAVIALLAAAASAFGANELLVLAGAALFALVLSRTSRTDGSEGIGAAPASRGAAVAGGPAMAMGTGAAAATAGVAKAFGLWPLFLYFAKVGAVLFGSGYVLLAFLRSGLVVGRGWLTEAQLLDAIAIGQVTPGPVFTTATFVGYLLGGSSGALVATLGIFLPAFCFVAVSAPLVPRLRASAAAGAMLDGVNAASLALMAVVTVRLGTAALVDPLTMVLALAAGALLLTRRVNSALLLLGSALAGLLAHLARGN